eukprot:PhM_4_TR17225/c0_g1_i1/m.106114
MDMTTELNSTGVPSSFGAKRPLPRAGLCGRASTSLSALFSFSADSCSFSVCVHMTSRSSETSTTLGLVMVLTLIMFTSSGASTSSMLATSAVLEDCMIDAKALMPSSKPLSPSELYVSTTSSSMGITGPPKASSSRSSIAAPPLSRPCWFIATLRFSRKFQCFAEVQKGWKKPRISPVFCRYVGRGSISCASVMPDWSASRAAMTGFVYWSQSNLLPCLSHSLPCVVIAASSVLSSWMDDSVPTSHDSTVASSTKRTLSSLRRRLGGSASFCSSKSTAAALRISSIVWPVRSVSAASCIGMKSGSFPMALVEDRRCSRTRSRRSISWEPLRKPSASAMVDAVTALLPLLSPITKSLSCSAKTGPSPPAMFGPSSSSESNTSTSGCCCAALSPRCDMSTSTTSPSPTTSTSTASSRRSASASPTESIVESPTAWWHPSITLHHGPMRVLFSRSP